MFTYSKTSRTYLYLPSDSTDCFLVLEKVLAITENEQGLFNVYVEGIPEPIVITGKQFTKFISKVWGRSKDGVCQK